MASSGRKRRFNRFAATDTPAAPPAPEVDEAADLASLLEGVKAAAAASKAAAAQKAAQEALAAQQAAQAVQVARARLAASGVIAGGATPLTNGAALPTMAGGAQLGSGVGADTAAVAAAATAKAAAAAALEAQIRATLANANSMFAAGKAKAALLAAEATAVGNGTAAPKKAQDHTLRLDEYGRQVDADGKVVKMGPVMTLKANRFGNKAHNPYLQHLKEDKSDAVQVVDPRVQTGNREKRAKRAFNFVEEGTYVKQGDNLRFREHRKLISGRMSGRNRAEQLDGGDDVALLKSEGLVGEGDAMDVDAVTGGAGEVAAGAKKAEMAVPAMRGWADETEADKEGKGLEMEWWDEAFLTKETRDQKLAGRLEPEQQGTEVLYALLQLENAKTFKYVQHPKKHDAGASTMGRAVGTEGGAGGGDGGGGGGGADGGATVATKVYLTKKERKRIRRTTRMEREREKQDKIALGLMPAPEPKMKMSNFMQVMGDQAVVDPSKVEALVMGQVARRKNEHEARNQAAKLTPQERRDKKKRKLLEDTSKEMQVAVFRLADMSDPKKRFKVDVNAQQRYLTGGVVMCTDPANPGVNMVVVEGGPKAVRAYVKLMTRRIRWGEEEFGGGESDSDSEEEAVKPALSGSMCELVWQGTVQARSFNAFKFQECKSPETARRVLEEKGVAHLWDMVVASAKAARASAASDSGAGAAAGVY